MVKQIHVCGYVLSLKPVLQLKQTECIVDVEAFLNSVHGIVYSCNLTSYHHLHLIYSSQITRIYTLHALCTVMSISPLEIHSSSAFKSLIYQRTCYFIGRKKS